MRALLRWRMALGWRGRCDEKTALNETARGKSPTAVARLAQRWNKGPVRRSHLPHERNRPTAEQGFHAYLHSFPSSQKRKHQREVFGAPC
jgi:hypothetical protein